MQQDLAHGEGAPAVATRSDSAQWLRPKRRFRIGPTASSERDAGAGTGTGQLLQKQLRDEGGGEDQRNGMSPSALSITASDRFAPQNDSFSTSDAWCS
jgi:hypothetical protein